MTNFPVAPPWECPMNHPLPERGQDPEKGLKLSPVAGLPVPPPPLPDRQTGGIESCEQMKRLSSRRGDGASWRQRRARCTPNSRQNPLMLEPPQQEREIESWRLFREKHLPVLKPRRHRLTRAS